MAKVKDDSKVNDFLLAEFNALQARAMNLEQVKANKVNFFLLVAGAVGAWVANMVDSQGLGSISPYLITFISLPLLVLGILTLRNIMQESVHIAGYYRRAGRIRLWFVEKKPEVASYVPFQYADDRPRIYLSQFEYRGGEFVILIINTLSFCGLLISLLRPSNWNIAAAEILVALTIGWLLQVLYFRTFLKSYEEKDWVKNAVHFPFIETKDRIEKAMQASKSSDKKGQDD